MTSAHSINRDLVAAVGRKARRAGEQAPSVRGSDWRAAIVTAVNTDGTVVADGLTWRRAETYQAPAEGDVIVVSQSSNGNLIAEGRLAATTAPNGAWTSLPLVAGISTPQAVGFGVAQYRIVTAFGTGRVELRGTGRPSAGLTAQTNVTTALPAGGRPTVTRRLVVGRNYSATALGVVGAEMSTAGILSIFGSSTLTTDWFSLDGVYYDL